MLGDDFWSEINKVLPKHGPNIDTFRTENSFMVVMEAPGISSAEAVSIKIKNHRLLISGRIPWTYTVYENELIQGERFIGEFMREIALPNDVNTKGNVEARFKNGLIEICIPVQHMDEEKEIPVGFSE